MCIRDSIYSYQESGIKSTWKRDLKIKSLCANKAVNWTEFQRDGVLRGIKNRKNWNKNWHIFMHSEIINNSFNKQEKIDIKNNFTLPASFLTKINKNKNIFQPAGETMAWKYLMSFSEERVKNYAYNISKPEKSLSLIHISEPTRPY